VAWSYRQFRSVLFDPRDVIRKWRALPYFIRNALAYQRQRSLNDPRLTLSDAYFSTADRFKPAGEVVGHYFLQDLWAAQRVYRRGCPSHVDIGSRLDGFVSHVMTFARVVYVDVRPLPFTLPELDFQQGSLLDLPFADYSVDSLSCLHVLEHVGLGRYGDCVIPNGHQLAARELSRILSHGGEMLVSVPVGRPRVCFDAHRVFSPETVVRLFPDLELSQFSLIPDAGTDIIYDAGLSAGAECDFGCGLFVFTRRASVRLQGRGTP
jgi:SAM-dependent methyltransferase